MSTLKTTNLQHASAASPAIVLASDGTATAQLSSLNGGALSGARNRIINGDMRIDQRNAGASVTIAAAAITYTVDRFWGFADQASKFSVQQNAGSVTPPASFANYLGCTSLSAYSVLTGDRFVVAQNIEGFNVADLGWGTANAKTVTLSFWVRSSLTNTFGGAVRNDGLNRSYPFSYTISSPNTWEQKTVTIAGDTSGTWVTNSGNGMSVIFGLGVGATYSGTAGAWAGSNFLSATGATSVVATNGATFYITGVQLEAGSVATPFERRSYGQELALCQRYYYRIYGSDTDANTGPYGLGVSQTSTTGRAVISLPVTMRTSPTALEQSGTASHYRVILGSSGSSNCSAVPVFASSSKTSIDIQWTVASGATLNQGVIFMSNNAASYIGASAEL